MFNKMTKDYVQITKNMYYSFICGIQSNCYIVITHYDCTLLRLVASKFKRRNYNNKGSYIILHCNQS